MPVRDQRNATNRFDGLSVHSGDEEHESANATQGAEMLNEGQTLEQAMEVDGSIPNSREPSVERIPTEAKGKKRDNAFAGLTPPYGHDDKALKFDASLTYIGDDDDEEYSPEEVDMDVHAAQLSGGFMSDARKAPAAANKKSQIAQDAVFVQNLHEAINGPSVTLYGPAPSAEAAFGAQDSQNGLAAHAAPTNASGSTALASQVFGQPANALDASFSFVAGLPGKSTQPSTGPVHKSAPLFAPTPATSRASLTLKAPRAKSGALHATTPASGSAGSTSKGSPPMFGVRQGASHASPPSQTPAPPPAQRGTAQPGAGPAPPAAAPPVPPVATAAPQIVPPAPAAAAPPPAVVVPTNLSFSFRHWNGYVPVGTTFKSLTNHMNPSQIAAWAGWPGPAAVIYPALPGQVNCDVFAQKAQSVCDELFAGYPRVEINTSNEYQGTRGPVALVRGSQAQIDFLVGQGLINNGFAPFFCVARDKEPTTMTHTVAGFRYPADANGAQRLLSLMIPAVSSNVALADWLTANGSAVPTGTANPCAWVANSLRAQPVNLFLPGTTTPAVWWNVHVLNKPSTDEEVLDDFRGVMESIEFDDPLGGQYVKPERRFKCSICLDCTHSYGLCNIATHPDYLGTRPRTKDAGDKAKVVKGVSVSGLMNTPASAEGSRGGAGGHGNQPYNNKKNNKGRK
ncbi:hypothetical protein AURDEDRAFT_171420 [Auricularia subglabra TFB-10046 SS5]|uniref:Uncharacterized protein n=1 Tax=Auricularia subglabra (strain TFB-10046 / SS5) TaxID=717982 RepID=J0WXH9_AURST|nr:hypothetical protein AURDEDRAFT_171420 [Auricularia subglabra TFB-10046 SS5]